MATKKKLLQAAAGSAGGAGGLDITDVFSTYLYSGNSSAQTITNGIDLDGEGGLWWLKVRSQAGSHLLFDSTRATGSEHFPLLSNSTIAEYDDLDTTPTSTGFTINSSSSGTINQTGVDYASWSFRKAPKFFDCVTWTGNGVAGREISHSLNSEVGMMLVKCTSATGNWWAYHRSLGENKYVLLNSTQAQGNTGFMWNATAPTSTEFTLGDYNEVNGSGKTFVAYLFAHNDADGEFGPDSDQDIIKCGSYTGNGSNTGPVIDLGFEPQWLMIKGATIAKEWRMFDTMRGMPVDGSGAFLQANSTAAEGTDTGPVALNANGFQLTQGGSETNNNGDTYIYMAIRRGPLAPPESATEVFDVKTRINADPSYVSSTGVVDMAIDRYYNTSDDTRILSRLTGKNNLDTNNNTAESTGGYTYYPFDYNTGWFYSAGAAEANRISWMWKRAPGFFDVVTWDAENTANRRLKHNLGVIPEMVWIKNREMMGAYTEDWMVYHKYLGSNGIVELNNYDDAYVTSAMWPSPSATEFGIRENASFNAGTAMIGYFFATLDGISKVGSYTGNGSNQTIDCGFTAGSRFILIKRTNNVSAGDGNWLVFDSVRGIVSGNSPYLLLNDNQASDANYDIIDPDNSGFVVNQETSRNLNASGGTYIFYAIA